MAGYVAGKPGHNQPRKTLARNPEPEVGAFLSVLLAVATVGAANAVAPITRSGTALVAECGHWNPGSQLWEPTSSDSPGLTTTSRGESAEGASPPDYLRPSQTPDSCLGVRGLPVQIRPPQPAVSRSEGASDAPQPSRCLRSTAPQAAAAP
jgi:hypothetical protein